MKLQYLHCEERLNEAWIGEQIRINVILDPLIDDVWVWIGGELSSEVCLDPQQRKEEGQAPVLQDAHQSLFLSFTLC